MNHLTAEQLVDLAEGAQPPSSVTHLRACDRCRRELAEIRSTMSMVAAADVPEPSPLAWEPLAARVSDAIDLERAREATIAGQLRAWTASIAASFTRLPVQVAAAAVVVMAVALIVGRDRPRPVPATSIAVSGTNVVDFSPPADDASLSLVADLAAGLDWESAAEAGLTTHIGVDDDLVSQLSDAERRELRQLLQGELSPPRRGA